MSAQEVIADAEVVPDDEPGRAVVRHEATRLSVSPEVQASELVERLATIRDAMDHAMVEGVDYGKVPGTNKPTLFKPGAEKLGVLFQLDIQIDNQTSWGPGDHLTVIAKAVVYHAPTGTRVGYGEGLCTTREKKYAYRKAERICPQCGVAAIIKGKQEYGGGWVCFKKKDGCGAKFKDGDEAIESQQVGEVENPDLPDMWNTVIKMAEKRARVDAVLAVTSASALFTQDLDEQVERGSHDDDGSPFGPIATVEEGQQVQRALAWMLNVELPHNRVGGVLDAVQRTGGGVIPQIACKAIVFAANAQKKAHEAAEQAANEASNAAEEAEARHER